MTRPPMNRPPRAAGREARSAALLHNMSVPPRTVARYGGLTGIVSERRPGLDIAAVAYGMMRHAIRFELPEELRGQAPEEILRAIGIDPGPDPERELLALVEERAARIPLPDACLVLPPGHRPSHAHLDWSDPLSALAVLAKCSDAVWLRDRPASLRAAHRNPVANLFLPPAFESCFQPWKLP